MYPLVFFVLILWLAYCFANVEIQIEGAHGWAEKLPTWRLSREHWVSRYFFAGKPATGYHMWLEIFLLSMLHVIYIDVPLTLGSEMQILAFFLYFCVAEDFLWFVCNPAFGIKNFRPEKIWWHRDNWILIMPLDYIVFAALATALYLGSFYV